MNLTKKDSVESAKKNLVVLQFFDVFVMYPDPDFPDQIRIFRIRIQIFGRIQKKSSIRIRKKKSWSETLHLIYSSRHDSVPVFRR